MKIKKSKPLTNEQLKTIVDGLSLLDEHPLAVCEGCMFRHKKEECPLSGESSRMCFDEIIWYTDFLLKNVRSLLVREQSNVNKEETT
jgi:hypothetical protein